ncbi:lipoprotein-releasing ABC transporter permease subunit [Aestuariispira insulae]|uniref:Lipoprotein-releasing system permease protein n=1 Tax=Aestuariispira insulae TaxID=1461337 RepID=A0A3D9HWL7_9PROT|nr:lipoprotein-releasing ABC transporter permease subunit [Aestuariispira insulae]RED53306.1 lipoprotein-releasing system permease protein [Aestuariispira insulae]
MFTAFERLVAVRYLRAKKQEGVISVIGWITVAGILLGVGALIVVMSVMNGFRHDLLATITGVQGHVVIGSFDKSLPDYEKMVVNLESKSGVTAASAYIEGQVLATANGNNTGALVRGMKREDILKRDFMRNAVVQGSLDGFDEGSGVLIGIRMARKLGIYTGSKIKLISPEGQVTAFGSVPRTKTYSVAGIVDVGNAMFDDGMILMPLKESQIYFRRKGTVNYIEVILEKPETARERMKEFRAEYADSSIWMQDWMARNSQFIGVLQVERNMMFIIVAMVVLVAAFNIISSQIMLVNDKAKGIAIMRTMGASRKSIMKIFMITGSSVGIVGTVLGTLAGVSLALNIENIRRWIEAVFDTTLFPPEFYFLTRVPASVKIEEVFWTIVVALVLSFLAAVIPAWRASRLDPVEVLRYE